MGDITAMTEQEIGAWRKQQRTALLLRRQEIPLADRQRAAEIIAVRLTSLVAANGYVTVGLYWPIKLEINLLPWAESLAVAGRISVCLPVVVQRKAPLEYWRWRQGEPMGRGIWDIPIPASRDVVTPDLMLAPLVGWDRANYRLGYGGGYFDRTLAAMQRRPAVVGIGYAFSALETIFPLTHDIPMDAVLTEQAPREGDDHAI